MSGMEWQGDCFVPYDVRTFNVYQPPLFLEYYFGYSPAQKLLEVIVVSAAFPKAYSVEVWQDYEKFPEERVLCSLKIDEHWITWV